MRQGGRTWRVWRFFLLAALSFQGATPDAHDLASDRLPRILSASDAQGPGARAVLGEDFNATDADPDHAADGESSDEVTAPSLSAAKLTLRRVAGQQSRLLPSPVGPDHPARQPERAYVVPPGEAVVPSCRLTQLLCRLTC